MMFAFSLVGLMALKYSVEAAWFISAVRLRSRYTRPVDAGDALLFGEQGQAAAGFQTEVLTGQRRRRDRAGGDDAMFRRTTWPK